MKDIVQYHSTEELWYSKDLFIALFESSLSLISLLKAVRNETGHLTDFRYIAINALARQFDGSDATGQILSERQSALLPTVYFSSLKAIVVTGNSKNGYCTTFIKAMSTGSE